MARVIVVGGGVAGLSAAWHLLHRGHEVQVLESTDRVGGKIRRGRVGGRAVDVGAESLLGRRPEGRELLNQVGLDVTHPAQVRASIWSRGALHPLPGGTLMGIPAHPEDAEGLLTAGEVSRASAEQPVDLGGDVALGELIAHALGDAIVDRLVEPLLGGVYAGHARLLSAQACLPQASEAVAQGHSLLALANDAAQLSATRRDEPVFATVPGGLSEVPERLAERLAEGGAGIRTHAVVRALTRTSRGWSLTIGETRAPERLEADAVLLATPAAPTARLIGAHAAAAADALATIEYASMAIATYAFARQDVPDEVLTSSGFLVPPVDGQTIKAATFSTAKWPWLAACDPELAYVRVSLGRHREERALQQSDRDLAETGLADLTKALQRELPAPVDSHVQRWGGGLPQYLVGHRGRVDRIRQAVDGLPGLELAGAAYDGVGVPACIGSGTSAAHRLHDQLL